MQHFPFNLEQLKILKAIETEKSFKGAAYKLYLSQPAISLQVKRLEYKLGFLIFDRSRKQICFTKTGKLLLDYSTKILLLCKEAEEALLNAENINKNKLIIGSSQTVGTYLLPKIIGLFCRRYSYAKIKLEVNSTSRVSWGIVNGQIDIGIVEEEIPNQLYGLLKSTPYVEDELILILPRFYRLNISKKIIKENLYELNFIALQKSSNLRQNLDKILNNNNIEAKRLRVKLELNSIEAIKNAVQAGLGVAFVSIFTLTDDIYLRSISLAKIENIKVKRTLSIILHSNTHKTQLFRKFYQYIMNLFNRNKRQILLNL